MLEKLAVYTLAAMLAWSPTCKRDRDRCLDIATDIAAVSLTEPSPLASPRETAIYLASIALEESGDFRADVDDGSAKGDGGQAICIMQIHPWPSDLILTRRDCIRVALERVRISFALCKRLPVEDRLGGYTHGRCVMPNTISRRRWRRMRRWIAAHP